MDSITFELATIKSKKDFILALMKLSKLLHESHIFSVTLTIKRTCVFRSTINTRFLGNEQSLFCKLSALSCRYMRSKTFFD